MCRSVDDLAVLPARALSGVGPALERRLAEAGVKTVGELEARGPATARALWAGAGGGTPLRPGAAPDPSGGGRVRTGLGKLAPGTRTGPARAGPPPALVGALRLCPRPSFSRRAGGRLRASGNPETSRIEMDSRLRGNDGRGPRAKPPRGPNAEWRRPTRSPPIARSARGFFTLTDSRPGIDAHGVLGTALPGNARVSPANGTARPPPVDAGGTRAFPGRPRPCRAPFPRPPPLRFDRAGFARANRFRGVKRPGGRRAPTFPQGRRRPSLAEAVRGCSERFSAILWRVGK